MDKKEDLEFIKSFGKISITNICKELKIDKGNLYHGKTTYDNIHNVALRLREELDKIL